MDQFVDRRSQSLLMDVSIAPRATPLQRDKECDVVVIGAGIAGISTAYERAIIRQGASKIAAYHDPSGRLYARSAACTHAGGHLHWNSFETCWDCPCHGSHFAVDGTPLNAPAIGALAEADIKTASADGAAAGQDSTREASLHSET